MQTSYRRTFETEMPIKLIINKMIKFRSNNKRTLNDKIISIKDHISILEQQIKDLKQHQKDIVETFNNHQHSKGSQYNSKTRTTNIYMSYCDD